MTALIQIGACHCTQQLPCLYQLTCTSFLVSFSSSLSLSFLGSTVMPPLAPPKGMSITAVFHVIRLARLHIDAVVMGFMSFHCVIAWQRLAASPSNIVKINLRVVSEPAFERPSAVIMLDTIGIEAFYLAIILGNDKLYKHCPLRCKKQSLKLFWILKFLQCLQTASRKLSLLSQHILCDIRCASMHTQAGKLLHLGSTTFSNSQRAYGQFGLFCFCRSLRSHLFDEGIGVFGMTAR